MSRRGRQEGFSLAEVVVALGLLASVLISMAGLLVLGNRMVHRGRGSSEALEVARDIMEETGSWPYSRLYDEFDCDSGVTQCTVDIVPGLPESIMRAWWDRLQTTGGGHRAGKIHLESIDDLSFEVSSGIRVRVAIEWQEGARTRTVDLVTVRM